MIAGADEYYLGGLEALGNFGRTQITGELLGTHMMRAGMPDVNFYGGYLYAAFFLTDDYMPWARKSGTLARIKPKNPVGGKGGGWGAWQVAARLSHADFTDQDVFGGVGDSVTLGLNWYINSNTGIQINYIRGQISDRNVNVGGTTYTDGCTTFSASAFGWTSRVRRAIHEARSRSTRRRRPANGPSRGILSRSRFARLREAVR